MLNPPYCPADIQFFEQLDYKKKKNLHKEKEKSTSDMEIIDK